MASEPGTPSLLVRYCCRSSLPLTEAKERLVEAFERTAIQAALDAHAGNVSAAARRLGIHRQSLQQIMARLGLSRS